MLTQTTLQGGGTPVINLQTETDSKSAVVRRPDADAPTDRFRLYEVPGSAHNDEWSSIQAVDIIGRDTFIGSGAPFPPLPSGCGWTGEQKITSFPVRYVANAAFAGLSTWAGGGPAAPSAALISAPNGATAGGIARDASGNALGGIRSPWLDAAQPVVLPAEPAAGAADGIVLQPHRAGDAVLGRDRRRAVHRLLGVPRRVRGRPRRRRGVRVPPAG